MSTALLRNLKEVFLITLITNIRIFDSKPIIMTKYGEVSGVETIVGKDKILTKFLGIPYAKPPLGSLRFQKPKPPAKWNGILNAENFKPACNEFNIPQNELKFLNFSLPVVKRSEDCLFLNIFIPGDVQSSLSNPKAVMFYIHGGFLIAGSSNIYRGDVLSISEDVIVVTINYRLGLFGFMATDDNTLPGNQGIFDQQTALKWVYENIQVFGGDISRITIFGHSAGGVSVETHLLNPISDKFFTQAIIQSSVSVTNMRTKSQQFELLKKVFFTKCGVIQNSTIFLKCLQTLSTTDILALHINALLAGMIFAIKDGEMVIDEFGKLREEMNTSKRIMVGYTRYDGDAVIAPFAVWRNLVGKGISLPIARQMISSSHTYHLGEKSNEDFVNDLIFNKYIGCRTDPLDVARSILNVMTDVWIVSNMHLIANTFTKLGGKVYLYRFDHFSEFSKQFIQSNMELFAGHSHELMYVWGSGFVSEVDNLFTEKEKLLSASIMRSFGDFAKEGKPRYLTMNGESVKWKKYTYRKKSFLIFNTNMDKQSLQLVPVEVKERMSFLNTVMPDIWNTKACPKPV